MKVLVRVLLFAAILQAAAAPPAFTQPSTAQEYELKAAFLYNFAKFIEWPAAPQEENFIVGVYGEDPFGPKIDALFSGKAIRDNKIVVRRFHAVQELAPCHILFISEPAAAQLPAVRSALEWKGMPGVLLVGESAGFAQSGGMIGFFVEGGRVRFEINQKAAGSAGLKISSQLLKLARIVG
jgi:hypothetical protein